MRRTISGATRKKTKVYDKESVSQFLEKELDLFSNLSDAKNCVYDDMNLVSDPCLNYLNSYSDLAVDNQLKLLLRHEFEKLDKIYPYLGDFFIENYFQRKDLSKLKSNFIFTKDKIDEFCNSLNFEQNKQIFHYLISKSSLEYNVSIESCLNEDIYIKKSKDVNFNLKYDSHFLGSKIHHEMNDYDFVIIDGIIETVGEVYHLLFRASQNKRPHVIFCFGMSHEVKQVIIENNTKGITEIFPVCLDYDENTINILNDIAFIHRGEIITSQKGQTISQEVRKDLKKGNKIIFSKHGFKVKPVASDTDLSMHRKYLKTRYKQSDNYKNKELILDRIKRLSTKNLKIYIPEYILKSTDFVRELDYVMRFLKNSNKKFVSVNKDNKKVYYLPEFCIELVSNVNDSLNKTYQCIEKVILHT
tara:strand:+ start:688 stop:1935 length:1248 start_codon:yes stop_codon:yes gene_type:complete